MPRLRNLAREAERRRAQRAQRVTENLCTECGDPRDDGFRICSECREAIRARAEVNELARIKRGLCRHCTRPAATGYTYCRQHLLCRRSKTGSHSHKE